MAYIYIYIYTYIYIYSEQSLLLLLLVSPVYIVTGSLQCFLDMLNIFVDYYFGGVYYFY